MAITEVLVRHFIPEFAGLADELAKLIEDNTELIVERVDHTTLTLDSFLLDRDDNPVSIDHHLAQKFGIPYMRVSRLFDMLGNPVARTFIVPFDLPKENVVLIDSDICTGQAIRAAMQITGARRFSIPLEIASHQDLIDVEDLLLYNSLLIDGTPVNYMINQEFFTRRTSLPRELYQPVKNVLWRL